MVVEAHVIEHDFEGGDAFLESSIRDLACSGVGRAGRATCGGGLTGFAAGLAGGFGAPAAAGQIVAAANGTIAFASVRAACRSRSAS